MTKSWKNNYESLDCRDAGGQTGSKQCLSIDEMFDHVGFGLPQIKIIMLSGFGWVAGGMETMVLTILGTTLQYEWHITPVQQALLTTLVFIGQAVGAPIWGYISDNYGRRMCLIVSSVWTLWYGVLCAAAPSFLWLLVLRMMVGLGLVGGAHVVTYYTELLPAKYRGKFLIFLLIFWTLGGLFAVVAAMYLMQYGWRYWLLAAALPTLIFIGFSLFIPESPRFELACGRKAEALRILSDLAAGNGRRLPDADLREMKVKPKGILLDLIAPRFKNVTLLSGFIQFSTGFLYFGIALFSTYLIDAGSTCTTGFPIKEDYSCPLEVQPMTMPTYVNLLWTTSAEVPGLIVTLFIVDTLGRKMGSFLQCLAVTMACLLLNICMTGAPMIILLFLGRGLSNSAFQLMFIYASEMYPTEIRSVAGGVLMMCNVAGGILTPFVAGVLLSWSRHAALLVYATVGCLDAVAIWLLPTDTKGRELPDVLPSLGSTSK